MRKIVEVGADLGGAAERGESCGAEALVRFATWAALASVMSDRRLELLQHLQRQPAEDVRRLACDLGRDGESVREDVEALERARLIDRDDAGRLRVSWEAIRIAD